MRFNEKQHIKYKAITIRLSILLTGVITIWLNWDPIIGSMGLEARLFHGLISGLLFCLALGLYMEKETEKKSPLFKALLLVGYYESWILIGGPIGLGNFSFHILHSVLIIYAFGLGQEHMGNVIAGSSMVLAAISFSVFNTAAENLIMYVFVMAGSYFYSVHLHALLMGKKTLQKKIDELETLYAIQKVLDSFPDIESVIKQITRIVTYGINVDLCAVMLYSQETGELELYNQYPGEDAHYTLRPEFKLADEVFRTGKAIVCPDLNQNVELLEKIGFSHQDDAIGILPLEHDGIRQGVILFSKKKEMDIDSGILQVVEAVASAVSTVLSNALYHNAVVQKTQIDDLTGLYNRTYFFEALDLEVKKAQVTQQNVFVLILDIDKFKLINDTYGHLIGDKVLEEIGRIIKITTRRSDIAARYGGEEFAIILPNICYSAAEHLAERLRRSVEKITMHSNELQSIEETITLSVGIASYPRCALEPTQLVHIADKRMYAAKRTGGNQYIFH